MLRLRVRARPFVAGVVTFRVIGDGDRCVVTMEEEPARRVIGNLVRPVLDPVTHVRNHRSLRRLGEYVRRHLGTQVDLVADAVAVGRPDDRSRT